MKTNRSATNGNLKVNKPFSLEILSPAETTNVLGGGVPWGKMVKKVATIIRDGLVYDTLVEAGKWIYENVNPQPTEQDLKRAEQGYTHIGGRQPWL